MQGKIRTAPVRGVPSRFAREGLGKGKPPRRNRNCTLSLSRLLLRRLIPLVETVLELFGAGFRRLRSIEHLR